MNNASGGRNDTTAPLVSIVTPSFNQAQFIEKTILSVVLQDYKNIEYFVLDAMSKDGTEQIMNKYSGAITKAIRAKDDGQSDAINKGFEMSRGEIMAYLNSDDCYSSPHTVTRVVELFQEHPDVDVIYGKREYIDEAGYFALNYPFRAFDGAKLLEACYIPQECVFWRRSIYERAGNKVDKDFKFAMDYDLWLRFLKAGAKFLAVDEYFGLFRWYPGQKSNDVWVKHGLPEIARLQELHLGKILPEDEMTASYQEYWYGVHRLRSMRTFSQSVRVWNTFMKNKKEMLSGLTRDAWVFMNHLQIPDRSTIGSDNLAQTSNDKSDVSLSELSPPIPFNAAAYAYFKKNVEKYSLFDPDFYKSQNNSESADPLRHFYLDGWRIGLNPHPLFDTNFYLITNDDVRAGGGNPLEHWMACGAGEGRNPHPLFNVKHYLGQIAEPTTEEAGLIRHYQSFGSGSGLSPHALFDCGFYLNEMAHDGGITSDALSHYLLTGWKLGKEPNAIFDSTYLRGKNPQFSTTICPLVLFVTQPTDGCCHPFFDTKFYEQQLNQIFSSKWQAVQHYVMHGHKQNYDPHPLFVSSYYLASAGKSADNQSALAHYILVGAKNFKNPHPLVDTHHILNQVQIKAEHPKDALRILLNSTDCEISPHPLFSPSFYAPNVQEAEQSSAGTLIHYWTKGWKAGLDGHPLSNTVFYMNALNLTQASWVEPIGHYKTVGHKEGRTLHPLFDPSHFEKQVDKNFVPELTALERFLLCKKLSLDPHPVFATHYYRSQVGLDEETPANLLIHYCHSGWLEGLNPHPLFDVHYYAGGAGREPLAHYLELGYKDNLDPHPLFDSEFYLAQRPSLRSGYISPLVHYILRGLNYQVSPHKDFDTLFYERIEPSVIFDSHVPPLVRYLQNCFHPGVDPNPNFDTDYYCELNPGLKESGIPPLLHFVRMGKRSRPASPFYDERFHAVNRMRFVEACRGKVVWSFLERGAEFTNERFAETGITIVDVLPTDSKYRTGLEKVRGLLFRITSENGSTELCFNPTKQISNIETLYDDTNATGIAVHNFFGADRELRSFFETFKHDFDVYLGDRYASLVKALPVGDKLAIELSKIFDDSALGDGRDFRPVTMLNWQASQNWILLRARKISCGSQPVRDFMKQVFPAFKVVEESLATLLASYPVRIKLESFETELIIRSVPRVRLGIPCLPGAGWTGGVHYLNSILAAAKVDQTQLEIETVLLASRDSDWQTFASSLRGWSEVVEVGSLNASWEIDALGLDCIFAAGGLIANCITPVMTWLYDFQHMEMPCFFSPADVGDRNKLFTESIKNSARIILSSRHAQDICHENYPSSEQITRVLSFVPFLSTDSFSADTSYIRQKYALPELFFYLPNQFWLHKNHQCVVDALAHLRATGKEVTVVCTGSTTDRRDELFYARLLHSVAEHKLRGLFVVLGMVPRCDVLALMKESCGLIQPSLYEGWSTSVEEAKAFDIPILLSDIPVHREQNARGANYFSPFDPVGLADLLMQHFAPRSNTFSLGLADKNEFNFRQFGANFLSLVEELTQVPSIR